MTTDYKSSVFLPKTDFPMRAGLPKKEPELLKRWADMKLFERLRAESKGRPKFVLHDGPPYANGNLHIGHALNKILKDLVSRTQQMLGKDSHYVPGWDCHGLPIEWKIEEEYRAHNQDKDAVPVGEFRRQCRAFADHWIGVQREEFKRLGVDGDWDNYYSTMAYESEAVIASELGKFLMNGGLYKGSKAVLWSVVEKTALAEAEIEYHDHTSDTVHVRFPVVKSKGGKLDGASIVIWTTTPWTIPGNRALAYGPDIAYALVEVAAVGEGSRAQVGEKMVLAKELVGAVAEAAKFTPKVLGDVAAADFEGLIAAHPLRGQGYEFDVRLLPGAFVTADAGTGFVHIAPGHGADDYELGVANGVEVPDTVAEDGSYYPHVPLFAGRKVYTAEGVRGDANRVVTEALDKAGKLAGIGPHPPLLSAFLALQGAGDLPQRAAMVHRHGQADRRDRRHLAREGAGGDRRHALRAARRLQPAAQHDRAAARLVRVAPARLGRADRGVRQQGRPASRLRDPEVMGRVVEAFRAEGADVWFESPPERFLGNKYKAEDFEQVTDILDVWFDSGCTHVFTLEGNPDLKWPADLYLEGSDQHRGWFHSSLLESCGTRGRAPYDGVLTHGFTLDEQGRKMSKSLGNITAPQTVCDQYGADILRLWVVGTDYTEDQRIGPEILKHQAEAYRRLRNTLRYLLGSLDGYSAAEQVAYADMPELERWVLHRLAELDAMFRQAVEDFDFHKIATELHNFCAVDLSAFYFDIRKDAIYCDAPKSLRRRAARTVMAELFSFLTAWLAPITCFTAEEAWLARAPDMPDGGKDSVHLRIYPEIPSAWLDAALGEKWKTVRALRRVVTGALELERAEKRIGSSLQAAPHVHAAPEYLEALKGLDLCEICITSGGELVEGKGPAGAFTLPDVAGVAVVPLLAQGNKCARCWQVLEEVGKSAQHPLLCRRCEAAVTA